MVLYIISFILLTMIKIIYNYLPKKQIVIIEKVRNSVINTVIIDSVSNDIFINGFKHTQKFYNQDINEYAKIIMDRIHSNKIKNL